MEFFDGFKLPEDYIVGSDEDINAVNLRQMVIEMSGATPLDAGFSKELEVKRLKEFRENIFIPLSIMYVDGRLGLLLEKEELPYTVEDFAFYFDHLSAFIRGLKEPKDLTNADYINIHCISSLYIILRTRGALKLDDMKPSHFYNKYVVTN